jgi:exodeoxyribonuclease VII small subunit
LQTDPGNDLPCFEDSLAELEAIVHLLEEGELGLAEALGRYEQGVKHLKHCYTLLQDAERKIELLAGVKDDGTPLTQPFAESGESLGESAGRKRSRRAKPREPNAEIRDNAADSADIDDSRPPS